jgi:hypothetical protein
MGTRSSRKCGSVCGVYNSSVSVITGESGVGDEEELGAKAAAQLLGVSMKTLREYRECGDLPALNKSPSSRIRPRWVYQRSDVLSLRARQRRQAAPRRTSVDSRMK